MDVYLKARELARLIEESKELCELKKLENKAMYDEKAQRIIMDYSEIYDNMVQALDGGNESEIEQLKNDFNNINVEVSEHRLTRDLFEAKEKFDKMIGSINDIISHAITGNESGCCGEGCKCDNSCDEGTCCDGCAE